MPDALDTMLEELKGVSEAAPAVASPLKVQEVNNFAITAGKLRALCSKYADHPLSKIKKQSVETLPDDQIVYVERIDLLAMIEDKDIDFVRGEKVMDAGGRVVRAASEYKKLVPKGTAKNPDPTSVISELRTNPGPVSDAGNNPVLHGMESEITTTT